MASPRKEFRFCCMLLLAQMVIPGTSFAAGFAVWEQSALAVARGLAGAAAVADDASTVFYNPAGMTRLSKNEVVVSTGIVFPHTRFENAGGFDPTGGPLSGSSSTPNPMFFVPSAFGVWAVSQDVRIGVGLNSPFGESMKYNDGWIGRYFATEAALKTINLSGTVAWRVTPALSVGGGLDYQTASANRRDTIDFGTTCFGVLGPAACAGLGLLPQAQDGSVKFDVNSRGVGYNLGILFEPREGLRLGAAYRSKIAHNFTGTADFSVPAAATVLTAGGLFRSSGVSTRITLPESLSVGIAADLSPRLTLLTGLIWTRSSRFDALVIRFDNPAQPPVNTPQNWKNGYRASVGFDYRFNAALVAHGGVAYDESPVPAQFRYPLVPDSDQLILSTGLTWKPSATVSLTVSYSYGHRKDAPISLVSTTAANAGVLSGVFKRDTNAFGLQAGLQF